MTKTTRRSFSLRLQPYEGSLLAEVVDYFNTRDRAISQRQIEDALVMVFLTQARLQNPTCSTEERHRTCLEACDALEKQASHLRQLTGVAQPHWQPGYHNRGLSHPIVPSHPDTGEAPPVKIEAPPKDEPPEEMSPLGPPPAALIEGQASAAQLNSIFD